MTELDMLIFKFIDRHKSVIKAFEEGKLERYIDSLCKSYYGHAGGDFHCASDPKGIVLYGERGSAEYRLTKKELCALLTKFLGGVK